MHIDLISGGKKSGKTTVALGLLSLITDFDIDLDELRSIQGPADGQSVSEINETYPTFTLKIVKGAIFCGFYIFPIDEDQHNTMWGAINEAVKESRGSIRNVVTCFNGIGSFDGADLSITRRTIDGLSHLKGASLLHINLKVVS